METSRFVRWLQILGPIGVLLGVALVIAQLNQTQNLVRLQLYTDIDLNRQQLDSTVLGEDFSLTLAKIRSSPDQLTDAELYQFEAYADSLIRQFDLYRILYDEGVFTIDWRFHVRNQVCATFNHPVGRFHLELRKNANNSTVLHQELYEQVNRCGDEDSLGYIEFIRDRINE